MSERLSKTLWAIWLLQLLVFIQLLWVIKILGDIYFLLKLYVVHR